MDPDPPWHNRGAQQNQHALWAWNWAPYAAAELPIFSQTESAPFFGAHIDPSCERLLTGRDALAWQSPPPWTMSGSTAAVLEGPTVQSDSQETQAPPRRHQFIHVDPQAQNKRRRVQKACGTCRERKTKCTGEQPVCQTCLTSGKKCLGIATAPQLQPRGHQQTSSTRSQSIRDGSDDNTDFATSAVSPRRHSCASTFPTSPVHVPLSDFHLRHGVSQSSSSLSAIECATSTSDQRIGETSFGRRTATKYLAAGACTASSWIPYFRYFGPAAVVWEGERPRTAATTVGSSFSDPDVVATSGTTNISRNEAEVNPPAPIQFYDRADSLPNSPLVSHLCETFFTYLGCAFPFLRRRRFLRDVEQKRVDGILVDAVCAVAARFSTHPALLWPISTNVPVDSGGQVLVAARGYPFSQRARAAAVDTLSHPTTAVVQAYLLLGYDQCASEKYSASWMYSGVASRMAQGLRMQQVEGMDFEGLFGSTPRTVRRRTDGEGELDRELDRELEQRRQFSASHQLWPIESIEERRRREKEQIDTFYCVFLLDRFVSLATETSVTLDDQDIEMAFPYESDDQVMNGWPQPFVPLIKIVHLYSRVTDALNINKSARVTSEIQSLAGMEKDLEGIYQRLSPRLHFTETNYLHYVKAQQGLVFILVHLWLHALVVLLHQPNLSYPTAGMTVPLSRESRDLSMSSAKTIADIIAFAGLMDPKGFRSHTSSPFISQPIYVAASAFLLEVATSAPSRPSFQPASAFAPQRGQGMPEPVAGQPLSGQRPPTQYTVRAGIATRNYQLCCQALRSVETYWTATRYFLRRLDEKTQGIMDLLRLASESLGDIFQTAQPAGDPAGLQQVLSGATAGGAPTGAEPGAWRAVSDEARWLRSSRIDPSRGQTVVIGWSVAGTSRSNNATLSFLNQEYGGRAGIGRLSSGAGLDWDRRPPISPDIRKRAPATDDHRVDWLVSLRDWYRTSSSHTQPPDAERMQPQATSTSARRSASTSYSGSDAYLPADLQRRHGDYDVGGGFATVSASDPAGRVGNVSEGHNHSITVDSHEIDLAGGPISLNLPTVGITRWLEYLPLNVLGYFGVTADPRAFDMS